MKISEALAERAELDKRILQLKARIKTSARYVEGEEPAEDPAELLEEAQVLLNRREVLVARINHRNAVTFIENPGVDAHMSLTEALAFRDRLNAQRNLLNEVADSASPQSDGYYGRSRRRSELPEKTGLPVKELRASADKLAKAHRELDARIQHSNWSTDL
jgi:hypothetical protein